MPCSSRKYSIKLGTFLDRLRSTFSSGTPIASAYSCNLRTNEPGSREYLRLKLRRMAADKSASAEVQQGKDAFS